MAFRFKHAGFAASLAAVAVLVAGAWLFTRTNEVRSAKAAQPAANSDVDIVRQAVNVTDKQADGLKILPVEPFAFRVMKNAVGSIDFNQNMLVQVFTPNAGKIVDTFFNVGDEVKKGDALFTIDSPDL